MSSFRLVLFGSTAFADHSSSTGERDLRAGTVREGLEEGQQLHPLVECQLGLRASRPKFPKTAVSNSLTCRDAQTGYRYVLDAFS